MSVPHPGSRHAYVTEVDRLGGLKPFHKEGGGRFNIKRGILLAPGDVQTDDVGNITAMTLMEGKPCLGRPERFLRGAEEEAIPPFTGRNNTNRWRHTRCQRCLVVQECSDVVIERIESSPHITKRFIEWDEAAANADGLSKFSGREQKRCWLKFLASIKAHGGWENSNERDVAAHQIEAEERRKKNVAARKRAVRAAARKAEQNRARELTEQQIDGLRSERRQRLLSLLSAKDSSVAPAYIKKLDKEGCRRMVDVWFAREVLRHRNMDNGGTAITHYLRSVGVIWYSHEGDETTELSETSMKARTYDILRRIDRLERNKRAAPFWPDSHLTP